MSVQQAVSVVVGVALSVLLQTLPWVRRWWDRQMGKTLILLVLHVGGAAGIWAIECCTGLQTGVDVTCSLDGFYRMAWTGILGFTSNQAAYGLTNYTVAGRKGMQALTKGFSAVARKL